MHGTICSIRVALVVEECIAVFDVGHWLLKGALYNLQYSSGIGC